MQLSVVHGGPSSRFSQVFRWLQPLTDDHFRDDKKGGGYSHGRGPIFPVGALFYRKDGARGANEGSFKILQHRAKAAKL